VNESWGNTLNELNCHLWYNSKFM